MRRVMLLLVFALSFIFAASVDAGTFFDDFDDGNDDGWFVEVGDWEVVDGVYRGLKTVPQWQTFALGGEAYGEFTIEVKIRNDAMALDLPDRCSIAGFAFGVGDDEAKKLNGVYWPGYYVYFRFHHGTLVLGSLAGELAAQGVFAAGDVGNWHLLKAEVSDKKQYPENLGGRRRGVRRGNWTATISQKLGGSCCTRKSLAERASMTYLSSAIA